MLSPKSSDILLNAGTFGADERGLWLPVLVGSRLYARSPMNFTDMETKLSAIANASLQAKQLNETMKLIDRIGPVDASTTGQEGEFSTLDNREGLIEYALSVIYGGVFWPAFQPVSVATPVKVRW